MNEDPAPSVGSEDPLERLVQSYLDRLLAGEAEPLEEFLRAHSADAEELRARIDALERAGCLPANRSAEHASESIDALRELPRRFDGFELVREIGRGGMGVVYEARQRALGRTVAIKVIGGFGLHSPSTRERFEREITTLARVRHPNIVTVFGSGFVRGSPYVVMELAEGTSLGAWIATGSEFPDRATVRRYIEIAAKIARALDHVHELGVVHRDVKPANILVNARDEPILLDFGLARELERETLTATGQFVGTLLYTAPEQALGKRVDRRADVYALGATLYHLVTGSPPYRAESLSDLVLQMQSGPPSSASRLNRSLSSDLATVLEHALAHEPQQRYASCADLADDLEAVLGQRAIRARRTNAIVRSIRWARRRRAISALIVVSVIALGLVAREGVVLAEASRRDAAEHRRQVFDETLGDVLAGYVSRDEIDQRLAPICDEGPQDLDAWTLRMVNALALLGSSMLSRPPIDPEQGERAESLFARCPSALRAEPAGQCIETLIDAMKSGRRAGAVAASPPGVRTPRDFDETFRLALLLGKIGARSEEAKGLLEPLLRDADAERRFRVNRAYSEMLKTFPSIETCNAAAIACAQHEDGPTLSTLGFCVAKLATLKASGDPEMCAVAVALARKAVTRSPHSTKTLLDAAWVIDLIHPAGWESEVEGWLSSAIEGGHSSTARWNLKNHYTRVKRDIEAIPELLLPIESYYGHSIDYWRDLAWAVDKTMGARKAFDEVWRGLTVVDPASSYALHGLVALYANDTKDPALRPVTRQMARLCLTAAPDDSAGLELSLEPVSVSKDGALIADWAERALSALANGVDLGPQSREVLVRNKMLDPSELEPRSSRRPK